MLESAVSLVERNDYLACLTRYISCSFLADRATVRHVRLWSGQEAGGDGTMALFTRSAFSQPFGNIRSSNLAACSVPEPTEHLSVDRHTWYLFVPELQDVFE